MTIFSWASWKNSLNFVMIPVGLQRLHSLEIGCTAQLNNTLNFRKGTTYSFNQKEVLALLTSYKI